MIVVVSDTSPIRAFAHVERLDVLSALFERVLIPPAVEEELLHPRTAETAVDVSRFPFIEVRQPSDRVGVERLEQELDRGESEALTLALEVTAGAVLIDERAGRKVAQRLGLSVIGTLGTLLRAKERGHVGAVRPVLERLESELGFFVSVPLRALVLRRAGED